jgi:glucosamine-6-phosphate deaminase
MMNRQTPRAFSEETPQSPLREFKRDGAKVFIYPSKTETSRAAAGDAASLLQGAIARQGRARLIIATGNSQEEMIAALTNALAIDWCKVEVFHMDEYAGIPATHPASFRLWVKNRFVDVVHPGQVHYLAGDPHDLFEECRRYGELLVSAPVDLCLLGIGENGHIAFNDPHVADFRDSLPVKLVDLDEQCRKQQVGEGHFPDFESVPREALTLTIPMLMSARNLVCCAPERRKMAAVRKALEGPLSHSCPASILRTHPHTSIFLDAESASLL